MSKNRCVLPDSEMRYILEYTDFSENDAILWVLEDGIPCGGLWDVAEQVAKTSADVTARIKSKEGRTLFALRNFYLYGVLRGAEAYRRAILPMDEEIDDIPFVLCDEFSEDFAESLDDTEAQELGKLLSMLGLTGPDERGGENE